MTPRMMPRSSSAICRSILLLAGGQRHGEYGVRAGRTDRCRGEQVGEGADRVLGHEGGSLTQHDGVVDGIGRASGQESGREQVALAGGGQPRPLEDVDVLVDHLAHEDERVVVYHRQRPAGRLLELLDHPLRHRCRPRGPGLDVAAELGRHVVANHQGKREHGNDRNGHEGEKQAAVEAGPDLTQQVASEAMAVSRERARRRAARPSTPGTRPRPALRSRPVGRGDPRESRRDSRARRCPRGC